jgi:hypothetical protein
MKSRFSLAVLLAGFLTFAGSVSGEEKPPAEPKLSDLSERIHKILELQTAVNDDTRSLHKAILSNPDKTPGPEDQKTSLKLAARQQDIVESVSKMITLLEKDDAASAFPEVLRHVCEDMKIVQSRLAKCEVHDMTQALEEDIVATAKEMIAARKNR